MRSSIFLDSCIYVIYSMLPCAVPEALEQDLLLDHWPCCVQGLLIKLNLSFAFSALVGFQVFGFCVLMLSFVAIS